MLATLWPAASFSQRPHRNSRAPVLPAIAITHVTVIDATGGPAASDSTVLVTAGHIARVGNSATVSIPRNALIVDGRGKYLIPGLWDMHVHLQEAGDLSLPLFIANGVTGVRDMGATWAAIRSRREAIATGKTLGPRIKASGPMITNPRVYDLIQKNATPYIKKREAQRRIRVETPEEMRKAVDDLKREGADFIKLHWNNTRETYLALADETRRLGITFAGHDPLGGITLQQISDAGQHSIEHVDGSLSQQLRLMDDAARQALYQRFIKNGTHWVPTLVLLSAFDRLRIAADVESRMKLALDDPRVKYITPGLANNWRWFLNGVPRMPGSLNYIRAVAFLTEMRKAGVRIMPGTDLGVPLIFPGFSLHEELEQMVKRLGMSPLEAIISATRYPAEFFGMQDSLGTIEKGKIAELILLDGDPLKDIANTRKINAVVLGGRLLDRVALDALLSRVETEALRRRN